MMYFDGVSGWSAALRGTLIVSAATLIGELAHYILFATLGRVQKWRATFSGGVFLRYTPAPTRLLLIVLAITIALTRTRLSTWATELVRHLIEISYIVAFTWLTIALIEIAHSFMVRRLPDDIEDNVNARRMRTRIYLLRQIMIGVFLFIGFAAILMTFPSIRAVGAGIFASAGVAGLVLGIAARPTLGNLIAGIQIALTQPIRINDSVVVEGQFGRVIEVNTTYVVIRLWDLRHMIVPISHFIERSFENWTRYSSDLIGSVHLQMDYTVPLNQLREQYKLVLESSPLWDGKTMILQVTDSKESTIEIRLLMSAQSPSATFDLRCFVREKMLDYLQREHAAALPKIRSEVALTGKIDGSRNP